MFDAGEAVLLGKHFIANIALDETLPGGLTAIKRDPRTLRLKMDAYVGRVERTGPGCTLVKVGDTVVIERWSYQQHDLDDERLIARERDVLVLAGEVPAPGVAVLQLEKREPPKVAGLVTPDTVTVAPPVFYFGRCCASRHSMLEEGKLYWIEKRDWGQFKTPAGLLAFRVDKDAVLMEGEVVI